jgi:hypothetical protein
MRVFDSIEDVKKYLEEREQFSRAQVARLEADNAPPQRARGWTGSQIRQREMAHHVGLAHAYNDALAALGEIKPGVIAKLEAIRTGEEATPESIQAKLREELKRAVADGVIAEFALRKGGRATIYRVDQRTKTYTESTLDTLTELSKERKRLGK